MPYFSGVPPLMRGYQASDSHHYLQYYYLVITYIY